MSAGLPVEDGCSQPPLGAFLIFGDQFEWVGERVAGAGKRIIKGRPFGIGFDRRIYAYNK